MLMTEYKTKQQKQRFYKSGPWRKLRLVALERDNYECQQCKRKGKFSKGQNVHHIKEIYRHPKLALELDNLETLCINCHNEEHKRTFNNIGTKKDRKVWRDERW
jgi:5-methylcytosine-specific restriction enzyme A